MSRIVATECLSLDGVAEYSRPDRGVGAPRLDGAVLERTASRSGGRDQLFASRALLLGRATYEEFVDSWPVRSGDPFTDRMNSLPKFVASTTLEGPLEWNKRDRRSVLSSRRGSPCGRVPFPRGPLLQLRERLCGFALEERAVSAPCALQRRFGDEHRSALGGGLGAL